MALYRTSMMGFVAALHAGLVLELDAALMSSPITLLTRAIEVEFIDDWAASPEDHGPPALPIPELAELPEPEMMAPEFEFADDPGDSLGALDSTFVPAPLAITLPEVVPLPFQVVKPKLPSRADRRRGMAISLPDYPRKSRMAGHCGSLVLALLVNEDSHIARVDVAESSGHPVLDRAAAMHAQRSWRLVPGSIDGEPVAMWSRVRVTFKLDRCRREDR